jgi:hypothetical protein
MKHKHLIPIPTELKPLTRLIESFSKHCNDHQAFYDFVEMAACSLSNRVDLRQYEVRELRYKKAITKYEDLETRRLFPQMLAELALALARTGGRDVLGPIAAALGMTTFRSGQYWTPWEVCKMMAQLTIGGGGDREALGAKIARHGFTTVCEPACGPGTMILAFADAMRDAGLDPKRQLHVTAYDIAPWCAHMAYCQLALMGIPAVVIQGDFLTGKHADVWFTPQHIIGGWSSKLDSIAGTSREIPQALSAEMRAAQ